MDWEAIYEQLNEIRMKAAWTTFVIMYIVYGNGAHIQRRHILGVRSADSSMFHWMLVKAGLMSYGPTDSQKQAHLHTDRSYLEMYFWYIFTSSGGLSGGSPFLVRKTGQSWLESTKLPIQLRVMPHSRIWMVEIHTQISSTHYNHNLDPPHFAATGTPTHTFLLPCCVPIYSVYPYTKLIPIPVTIKASEQTIH